MLRRNSTSISLATACSGASGPEAAVCPIARREGRAKTVQVFRFQNDTHKDVKLLLLDPAPKPHHGDCTDPEVLGRYMRRHRHRIVVVGVGAKRQKEVPLASSEVMCWGGFRHDAEVYERFCNAEVLNFEPGRWITIGSQEMDNPGNTWWEDISIEPARRVSRRVFEKFDGLDRRCSGDDEGEDVCSMSSDGSFFISSELDTSFRRPKGEESPGAKSCAWKSEASTAAFFASEGFYSSEGESAPGTPRSAVPRSLEYEVGEDVEIFSSTLKVWIAGRVIKVLQDGAVRVRYDGSFQKEVPKDKQQDMLRRGICI